MINLSSNQEISILIEENNKNLLQRKREKKSKWTKEEDELLLKKGKEYNNKKWKLVASFLPGHSSVQCSARYKRIQSGIIKGSWNKEEDKKLLELYNKYGKNWAKISKEMHSRTGKQVRDRFLNFFDNGIDKRTFTEEEDEEIIKLYKQYGNSWTTIAKFLKGRTGDMVKNRFYSKLNKIINKQAHTISSGFSPNFNNLMILGNEKKKVNNSFSINKLNSTLTNCNEINNNNYKINEYYNLNENDNLNDNQINYLEGMVIEKNNFFSEDYFQGNRMIDNEFDSK